MLEEWDAIDLLAVSAWNSGEGVGNARVGYEVKVSRADYRRELLAPYKRQLAVEWCHVFYFATPAGLLKAEEVAFVEPEWSYPEDFDREPCRFGYGGAETPGYDAELGPCHGGKRNRRVPSERQWHKYDLVEEKCEGCGGRGYAEKSRIEREAPTLWVPRDVGLVEVDAAGRCQVARRARRRKPDLRLSDRSLAQLVRYVSVRPDPRHAELRP